MIVTSILTLVNEYLIKKKWNLYGYVLAKLVSTYSQSLHDYDIHRIVDDSLLKMLLHEALSNYQMSKLPLAQA